MANVTKLTCFPAPATAFAEALTDSEVVAILMRARPIGVGREFKRRRGAVRKG